MDPERPREVDEAPEAGLGSLDFLLADVGPPVDEFLWARSPVFTVPILLRFLFILNLSPVRSFLLDVYKLIQIFKRVNERAHK